MTYSMFLLNSFILKALLDSKSKKFPLKHYGSEYCEEIYIYLKLEAIEIIA